jgi:unsaturated rhamnogalacturonyl hydrolase
MKNIFILILLLSGISITGLSQNTQTVTDVNTPLHTLQPAYPVPYGPPKYEDIRALLNRIYIYLNGTTPVRVIDNQTNQEISDLTKLTPTSNFEKGTFRLISYEWGVLYGAMLAAGEATGDPKYNAYTIVRMKLIADLSQYYKSLATANPPDNYPVRSVLDPRALDDAGSMCAAMIKSYNADKNEALRPLIDNYIKYISNKQFRLSDGTLARNRPLPNTLWLDDLYMSVPALAQMGTLSGNFKYFDDAVVQILHFSDRMYNKNLGLFCHGFVQDMKVHPEFFWARANGWAILAVTELLDVMPPNHSWRNTILDLFRAHIKGITSFQSGTGFWHQLLNRNDSYYETSATAIFTYCLAHGINKGWIDASTYGPAAVAGWNAVQTKITPQGHVEGTCVGTGMAFDPLFYYNRPVNDAAAHGYGPVVMAGAEMLKLLKNYQIVLNDGAVMFYQQGVDPKNFR